MVELLRLNFNVEVLNEKNNNVRQWKHIIPGKAEPGVVDVFIVRDLWKWLVSFHKTQWHIQPVTDFAQFLTTKHHILTTNSRYGRPMPIQYDSTTGTIVNINDENKTIFEIRYEPMQRLRNFIRINKLYAVVKLDYLQENESNVHAFVDTFQKRFLPGTHSIFQNYSQYLGIRTREYNLCIKHCVDKINQQQNNELEDWVDTLTYEISD